MKNEKEHNLIYIGTIENYNSNYSTLKLRDIVSGYEINADCREVYVGFSRNFLEKYQTLLFEFINNRIIIELNEKKEYEQGVFMSKAVFVDRKFIVDTKPDFFLVGDILDCEVFDIETDKLIGYISDVSILPENDVWFIKTDNGEMPIPVIKDVVRKVDIETKRIYVKLLDGLTDLIKTQNQDDDE